MHVYNSTMPIDYKWDIKIIVYPTGYQYNPGYGIETSLANTIHIGS